MSKQENTKKEVSENTKDTEQLCGIVMPIATMSPEYTEAHWKEVLKILEESACKAGYKARLVSDSNSINIIQKDIVQNLYTDEVVVCDVSNKNPNVLFELGMRLTFDKPTIIIKDDMTKYIFDINVIKHIEYPKDLNYHAINAFKDELSEKIIGTIKAYKDPKFTTFLKHFKDVAIKPQTLETEEISQGEAILSTLKYLDRKIDKISVNTIQNTSDSFNANTLFEETNIEKINYYSEFELFYNSTSKIERIERGRDINKWLKAFLLVLQQKYAMNPYSSLVRRKAINAIEKYLSSEPLPIWISKGEL